MAPNRHPLLLAALPLLVVACTDSGSDPPDPAPVDCTPANALALDVGEAREFRGGEARRVCVSGGGSGADFVLVAFSADSSSGKLTQVRAVGNGITGVTFPPRPSPGEGAAAVAPPGAVDEFLLSDAGTAEHARLRSLERRHLAPLVGAGAGSGPPRTAVGPATVPAVGDLMTINAQSSTPCSNPINRTGRVRAVSNRAIVVADTLNPTGGFDTARYEHFAAAFDTLVVPNNEPNFGTATDLDGNGRVILFYTQEVNRLTAAGSDSFIEGFFFARDLFPTTTSGTGAPLGACATSNVAEILYLMVPDPAGAINGNERSLDFVNRIALITIVHEYQHLINAAERLHIFRSSTPFEETWLDEALSHMAEELLFYRVSGMLPGRNIGIDELRDAGQGALDAINAHQLSNVFRLRRYLIAPHSNSPYNTQYLLATRGAAWHFLRYLLDRKGGSAASTLRPLVASHAGGYQNLAQAAGGVSTLQSWLADWSVALYADDRVPGIVPQHTDRSWNHESIYANLFPDSVPTYPLRVNYLVAGQPRSESVMGGGSTYLRFGVPQGSQGQIDLTVEDRSPPETLRATLMRTR